MCQLLSTATLQMVRRLQRNFPYKSQKRPKIFKNYYQNSMDAMSWLANMSQQLEEALDSSKQTTIVHPHSSSSKRELIDAYLTIRHAGEEISMVTMGMTYTRQHYVHEISAMQNCIQQYSKKTDAFSRGGVALLHGLLTKLCIRVSEIHDLFSVISNSSTISMPVIPGGTGSDSDEEVLVKD